MSESSHPARVRYAPSPTGHLHLGGARTALYNYLLARKTGGQFILRIEDTDRKRFDPESEQELREGLHWLGLSWEEGPEVGGPHAPYHQSERKEIYQEYASDLIERGRAYYCFCSPARLEELRKEQQRQKQPPHYDGRCRRLDPEESAARVAAGEGHVIRFKTPTEGSITVEDLLRGEITVENENLDDYILVKSDGLALYHLAAMVDDHLMGITHVIRGSEWLPTFPLHVHIYRAFGWEEPKWIHLSVFLNPTGKGKMSKREATDLKRSGRSIYIKDLQEMGYVPEAVLNWMVLMGWSYDGQREFFTLPELVETFSLERLNPSPAAVNFSKLDHFNGLHIRNLSTDVLAERLAPFFEEAGYTVDAGTLEQLTPLIQERIVTLEDGPEIAGFFFEEEVHPNPEELVGKKMTAEESVEALERAIPALESLPDFQASTTEGPMRDLAGELGLKAGQLFGILRVAVTGQRVSPPLFESMEIVGQEKSLARMREAKRLLENLEQPEE